MPIIITLDIVLAKRKMRLSELSQMVGIDYTNMSILKNGRGNAIRFTTLDAICDALECQPGDILQHVSKQEYNKIMRRG